MTVKIARANVRPQRQPNQYSCTTTSLSCALEALGIPQTECNVERVNAVLGAQPLQGASWDQVAGAASHFGCRATLVVPSTLKQVRAWTDAGTPVLIGWNTGSEWSHASLIFDVTDTHVHIADPNITNPEKLVHVLTHDEFYDKWYEKAAPGYKIRRSAMAIEREITPEGRQVMASSKVAERYLQANLSVDSFDGWKTTTSGFQISTIGGERYLTLFDLQEKLPGQPPDFYRSQGKYLVEFQVGPKPRGWSLPQADLIRVVGPAEENLKTGKKLKEVWGVVEPRESSELEDIWFDMTPLVRTMTNSKGDITVFDSKTEAKIEAQKRLDARK